MDLEIRVILRAAANEERLHRRGEELFGGPRHDTLFLKCSDGLPVLAVGADFHHAASRDEIVAVDRDIGRNKAQRFPRAAGRVQTDRPQIKAIDDTVPSAEAPAAGIARGIGIVERPSGVSVVPVGERLERILRSIDPFPRSEREEDPRRGGALLARGAFFPLPDHLVDRGHRHKGRLGEAGRSFRFPPTDAQAGLGAVVPDTDYPLTEGLGRFVFRRAVVGGRPFDPRGEASAPIAEPAGLHTKAVQPSGNHIDRLAVEPDRFRGAGADLINAVGVSGKVRIVLQLGRAHSRDGQPGRRGAESGEQRFMEGTYLFHRLCTPVSTVFCRSDT